VAELFAEFWKLEERHSRLERPAPWTATRSGPIGRLFGRGHQTIWGELASWCEVDAELEALWTSIAWVRDMVLDNVDGPSSLVASLSTVVELLEGWVDTAAANGVLWGTRSTLISALSYFSEVDAELELLMSRHNADLTEDQVDALWTWVCAASDSLASHVLPSIAHSPPNGTGEW
jgi:hypothetical protein